MKHLLYIILFLSTLSCVTKRETITEVHTDTIYNETHDTVLIKQNRIDTVYEYQTITRTDTIRELQTKVITLKESGDTIREVINNNVYKYVYQKDSTNKYAKQIDSLQQAITQLKSDKEKITNDNKKEIVKTKRSIWSYIETYIIIIALFFMLFLVVKKYIKL